LSILANKPELLRKLFVSDQYKDNGIYVVRFFKEGRWVMVIIDDRIPCDVNSVPLYARSKDENEIWVMLLEKAYAKLHGCYEALSGGMTDYGLKDLTGGVPLQVSMSDPTAGSIWSVIQSSIQQGHTVLIGCAIVDNSGEFEVDQGQGLLSNHAFSTTSTSGAVKGKILLQIRNPWGRGEWLGDWSDQWEGWSQYESIKGELGWKDEDDGTFWMDAVDFAKVFTDVYVCDIAPPNWYQIRMQGAWKGTSAGGCMNNKSWGDNPYFKISVEARTEVLMVLTQPDARLNRGRTFNVLSELLAL
jgi:hypothetical protein